MNIEGRLKRIEEKLRIDSPVPWVLIIGRKDGRKVDEAEVDRQIEEALRRQPGAEFILIT
jgi:hypothetical protein